MSDWIVQYGRSYSLHCVSSWYIRGRRGNFAVYTLRGWPQQFGKCFNLRCLPDRILRGRSRLFRMYSVPGWNVCKKHWDDYVHPLRPWNRFRFPWSYIMPELHELHVYWSVWRYCLWPVLLRLSR